ncbi:hypothetical protein BJ742DRAFT_865593 [Cladochytrium replicatum]|nr:hypothetical protein BJ742DRAFT_865593 [Cladochytrium replicatum]
MAPGTASRERRCSVASTPRSIPRSRSSLSMLSVISAFFLLAQLVTAQNSNCIILNASTQCGEDFDQFPILRSSFSSIDVFNTFIVNVSIDYTKAASFYSTNFGCTGLTPNRAAILRWQTSFYCSRAVKEALRANCTAAISARTVQLPFGPVLCPLQCSQAQSSLSTMINSRDVCPVTGQGASFISARTKFLNDNDNLCRTTAAEAAQQKLCSSGVAVETSLCGWQSNSVAVDNCKALGDTSDCCKTAISSAQLPVAAIAGGVAGGVAFMGIVTIVVIVLVRRNRMDKSPPSENGTRKRKYTVPRVFKSSTRRGSSFGKTSGPYKASLDVFPYEPQFRSPPSMGMVGNAPAPLDLGAPYVAMDGYAVSAGSMQRAAVGYSNPSYAVPGASPYPGTGQTPYDNVGEPYPPVPPPKQMEQMYEQQNGPPEIPELDELDPELMIVVYPYEPAMPDELRLTPGEDIIVLKNFDDGWGLGALVSTRQQGAFPIVCVARPNELPSDFFVPAPEPPQQLDNSRGSMIRRSSTISAKYTSVHAPGVSRRGSSQVYSSLDLQRLSLQLGNLVPFTTLELGGSTNSILFPNGSSPDRRESRRASRRGSRVQQLQNDPKGSSPQRQQQMQQQQNLLSPPQMNGFRQSTTDMLYGDKRSASRGTYYDHGLDEGLPDIDVRESLMIDMAPPTTPLSVNVNLERMSYAGAPYRG